MPYSASHTEERKGVVKRRARVLKRGVLIILGLLGVMTAVLVVVGLTARGPGDQRVPAGYTRNESFYLTMRDDTRIAVDLWYPADLKRGEKVPTLLYSTRYGRALESGFVRKVAMGLGLSEDLNMNLDKYLSDEIEAFNEAGYAVVLVDVRGAGASFGARSIEWSPEEVADLGEVVDWIVGRPWSNDRVGSFGVSYEGNTAELTAVPNRPAVKAVAPLYDDFDPLLNLAMPGGVLNKGFMEAWSALNERLDANDLCGAFGVSGPACFLYKMFYATGIKPVDSDEDGSQLAEAVSEHRGNYDVYKAWRQITYHDDQLQPSGLRAEQFSPYGLKEPIERSGAAMYVRVGWLDAATASYALSRYETFSNSQKLFIGPWNHGGDDHADPFLPVGTPVEPSPGKQIQQLTAFFDAHLKGEGDPGSTGPRKEISYYAMNGGGWKTTREWPPPGFEEQRLYFGANGSLTEEAPTNESAADDYKIDFTATTGESSRWSTSLGGDVVYPDRAKEDQKLLTYTGAPLPNDVEITGNPLVTLDVSSTVTDGAFHVYLEDVAPDGRVTYITEGIFRALHREISEEEPPYRVFGPYHSVERKDGEPLVPNEVAEVEFELYATSVRIDARHRLRIAIAVHDASTFARIPDSGTPTITVYRNEEHAAFVELPMKELP